MVLIGEIRNSNTFEEQLNANINLFDSRLGLIVGGEYLRDKLLSQDQLDPFPIFNLPSPGLYFHLPQKTTAGAVFADAKLRVTDRLRLLGGVRYSRETKSATQDSAFGALVTCDAVQLKKTFTSVTPKAGVEFDVAQHAMTYFQWQKGFKAGGFNASGCNNVFQPEKVSAFEGGVKTSFLNGQVTFNVAGFHYDYTNLQVASLQNAAQIINNAGAASITGVEAQLTLRPVETFTVETGISALPVAKYTKFVSCDSVLFSFNCSLPAGNVQQDVSGNRLNRAPTYTITVAVEYRLPLPTTSRVSARAELYSSGPVSFREFNDPRDIQKSYNLINLYLNFHDSADRVWARAFAKNVGNVNYLTSILAQGVVFAHRLGQYGEPRTYGLEVGYHF